MCQGHTFMDSIKERFLKSFIITHKNKVNKFKAVHFLTAFEILWIKFYLNKHAQMFHKHKVTQMNRNRF